MHRGLAEGPGPGIVPSVRCRSNEHPRPGSRVADPVQSFGGLRGVRPWPRAGNPVGSRSGRPVPSSPSGRSCRCRGPRASSTSTCVTADPSPTPCSAGRVATPTTSVTSPTGRWRPAARMPRSGCSATAIRASPDRSCSSDDVGRRRDRRRRACRTPGGRLDRRAECQFLDAAHRDQELLVLGPSIRSTMSSATRGGSGSSSSTSSGSSLTSSDPSVRTASSRLGRHVVHPLDRQRYVELAHPLEQGPDGVGVERARPAQARPGVQRPAAGLSDEDGERPDLLGRAVQPRDRVVERFQPSRGPYSPAVRVEGACARMSL